MNTWEIHDERYECLKYPELDIDTLAYCVVHCADDGCDGGLGHGLQRDEPLQAAQRYGYDFSVLCRTSHEHRAQKVVRLWTIYHVIDSLSRAECETMTHVLT